MSPIAYKAFPGSHEQIENLSDFIRTKLESAVNKWSDKREFLDKAVLTLNGVISVSSSPLGTDETGGSLIIYPDKKFEIFLSPFTSPLRDNFTIAHELGHLFLHYPFNNSTKKPIRFTRYGSDLIEWQANRFAAAFLMPMDQLLVRREKYKNDIEAIASYFEVSRAAAAVRMGYIS